MSTITIHNKEYRIYEVTGKILESNKQRELHVYGSGGGGATYNGTGGTAPVNIQSSTTIHDEFFLIDQDGQEHSIKLKNWDVSLREGHEIQVIWVISPNQERGPYVVLGVVSGNGKYSTLRFFNCAQWPKFSTTYLGFASP